MGSRKIFELRGKDVDDYQLFIDKLAEHGFEHLFDDPDSCHEIYNIGIRKCINCVSFAWCEKDNKVYEVNCYTVEHYYTPEENVMEVEVSPIDEITQEDWEDYWKIYLKEYAEEYLEKIRKAYNLK